MPKAIFYLLRGDYKSHPLRWRKRLDFKGRGGGGWGNQDPVTNACQLRSVRPATPLTVIEMY